MIRTEDKMTGMIGAYKLSAQIVKRMCERQNGLSGYEIMSMIYLGMIADLSGTVTQMHVQELRRYTGCSERHVYNILQTLISKKFIKIVNQKKKNGYVDIVIIDNDFRNKKRNDYRHSRYLNLNHDAFIPGTECFGYFKNLSLYAKRLYLYILLNYKNNSGCMVNPNKNPLAVRGCMVDSYMNELQNLLKDSFQVKTKKYAETIRSGKSSCLKYICNGGSSWLVANRGISVLQPTALKHKLETSFVSSKITLTRHIYSHFEDLKGDDHKEAIHKIALKIQVLSEKMVQYGENPDGLIKRIIKTFRRMLPYNDTIDISFIYAFFDKAIAKTDESGYQAGWDCLEC